MVHELRGTPCLDLEQATPDRKGIIIARRYSYRPQHRYMKAGVMLLDLHPAAAVQGGLFDAPDTPRMAALMRAVDALSLPESARLSQVDAFFAATGAEIREGTRGASYSLPEDYIGMPPFGAVVSAEAHATTLGHECVHWTRHATRLNRDFAASLGVMRVMPERSLLPN